MPNWKNEAEYSFTENLSAEGWAWEFLRRNPNYRDAYIEVNAILSRYEDEHGSDRKSWPREEPAFVFSPPKAPQEDIPAWRIRCGLEGDQLPKIVPVDQYHAHEWGLRNRMFNPEHGVEQGVRFLPPSEYPRLLRTWEEVEVYRELVETDEGAEVDKVIDDKALVAFDLTLPFKKQIARARGLLKKWQDALKTEGRLKTEFPKNYKDKWRVYLRALDAHASGASKTEIAGTLWSMPEYVFGDPHPSSKAGETLELADRIVHGGYRKILFFDV